VLAGQVDVIGEVEVDAGALEDVLLGHAMDTEWFAPAGEMLEVCGDVEQATLDTPKTHLVPGAIWFWLFVVLVHEGRRGGTRGSCWRPCSRGDVGAPVGVGEAGRRPFERPTAGLALPTIVVGVGLRGRALGAGDAAAVVQR